MLTIKTYALLIRKWMDDLQSGMYELSVNSLNEYNMKQAAYTKNMDRLFKRLQREHGFDKKKFYALQDQAVMF